MCRMLIALGVFCILATSAAAANTSIGAALFGARFAYGGLPAPASWLLMVIGFGMIGAALRGFVIAHRAIARLQPDE